MKRTLPDADYPAHMVDLDYDLLVSQRNELFAAFRASGFVKEDFEWVASDGSFFGIEGSRVPMFRHTKTRFYCKFGFLDEAIYRSSRHSGSQSFGGEFFLQRSPANTKLRDTLAWMGWQETVSEFENWLKYLRREMTDPDFWVIQPSRDVLPAISPEAPNEPFTPEEQKHVAASLDEIRQEVRKMAELSEAQKAVFDSTIQEMKESSTRLGRKDWINAFLGNYIWWVVTSVVRSEIGQRIFDLASTKLSWLWTELPKLLP